MKNQTNDQASNVENENSLSSYSPENASTTAMAPPANNNTANTQHANQTVIGVFESRARAENAVNTLRKQGFTTEEINIVSKKQNHQDQDKTYDDDITDGTLTGGTLGGIGGLLMGAGALMLPGIGPIIAVGPITAAVGGAIAGGIAGGLIDWGIPAEASHRYEQEVAGGSILAIIRTDTTKVNSAAEILRQNGAKDVQNHSK
ncbi:general stress protein [Pelosinus propionicus]|uniref:Heat induced stress protein YflT n=1 Tax=Pelosinus propionicus DSM 13327 TaxID=1123291 RepID=A0A1I4H9M3_9FIRM|nr:general stress protein [Pelosinus propionicus]SFL39002.1 Heat induced stress protein YflT [Pelosinus propionicus DSM 13327]